MRVSFDELETYNKITIEGLSAECNSVDGSLVWDTGSGLILDKSGKIIPATGSLIGSFTYLTPYAFELRTGMSPEKVSVEPLGDYNFFVSYDYLYY